MNLSLFFHRLRDPRSPERIEWERRASEPGPLLMGVVFLVLLEITLED